MSDLPTPATSTDMYLQALVMELRILNAQITQLMTATQPQAQETPLKEPKPAHRDAMKSRGK